VSPKGHLDLQGLLDRLDERAVKVNNLNNDQTLYSGKLISAVQSFLK